MQSSVIKLYCIGHLPSCQVSVRVARLSFVADQAHLQLSLHMQLTLLQTCLAACHPVKSDLSKK